MFGAREYLARNPEATNGEFKGYWDGLAAAEKKVAARSFASNDSNLFASRQIYLTMEKAAVRTRILDQHHLIVFTESNSLIGSKCRNIGTLLKCALDETIKQQQVYNIAGTG
jgi:hypothetical protein